MTGFWLPGDKWHVVPKPIGFQHKPNEKPAPPKIAPERPPVNEQPRGAQH